MTMLVGLLFVFAGGILEGLFGLSVTRTPNWKWEHTWGLGSLLALLLVPWTVALLTVPNLGQVFAQVSPGALLMASLFGLAWGIGGRRLPVEWIPESANGKAAGRMVILRPDLRAVELIKGAIQSGR